MLVKFFKPTIEKGCLGGIDYLMGDKDRSVSPELISGNLDVTRQLLLASTFKNQYTTGCLSFAKEESDISKELQSNLMQSFEETLMSGLDASQYDCVWIKHTDKDGRLELNFHIVNTELNTGKRLQPYLHKFDMPRIEAWKSLQNDLYQLGADPNAPERKRMLSLGNNNKKRNEVQAEIHNYLEDCWIHNEINNRNDLINELNNLGIEVTRTTKQAISIKVPEFEKPIRLKGELYNDNLEPCEKQIERKENEQRKYNKEREQRIERNNEKLERLNQRIAEHRSRKYKQLEPSDHEFESILDSGIVGDFSTDVNVRIHHMESDNELLHNFISRVQANDIQRKQNSNSLPDEMKPLEQLKKVEKDEHRSSPADRDFTQRIRTITNAIRCAIQELREAFRRSEEHEPKHDNIERIASNKRAQRLDIQFNEQRAAEQRMCEVQQRQNEHSGSIDKRKKPRDELSL